jgi:hypothetical protein
VEINALGSKMTSLITQINKIDDLTSNKFRAKVFLVLRKQHYMLYAHQTRSDDIRFFMSKLPDVVEPAILTRHPEGEILIGINTRYVVTPPQTSEAYFLFKDLEEDTLPHLQTAIEILDTYELKNYEKLIHKTIIARDIISLVCKLILHEDSSFTNSPRNKWDYDIVWAKRIYELLINEYNLPKNSWKYNSQSEQTLPTKVPAKYLCEIVGILEFNNIRIALIKRQSTEWYKIFIFHHTHQHYNYVDMNRVIVKYPTSYHNNSIIEGKSLGNFIFTDIPCDLPKDEVILNYFGESNRTSDSTETQLLDNKALQNITRRYLQKQSLADQENEQEEMMRDKVKKKVNLLKDPAAKLKLNDVIYKNKTIEYQGQVLKLNIDNWVHTIFGQLTASYKLDLINFDIAFQRFIDYIQMYVKKSNSEVTGTIGEVDFKLHADVITSTKKATNKTTYSTRYFINDYRINGEEVGECLTRALCFTTQEDYNEFLSTISQCSLKIHTYLHEGISFTLSDDITQQVLRIKVILDREKNRHYITLGANRYQVHDIQKLFSLSGKGTMLDFIEALLEGSIVSNVKMADVKDIIDKGVKLYELIAQSEEKLITDTEKLFNLTKMQNIRLNNNIVVPSGYVVKGNMRTYCVSAVGRNEVYSYPDGGYICIINKSSVTNNSKEGLINRLYALHNDRLVAPHVHTLTEQQGGPVDVPAPVVEEQETNGISESE